MYFAYRQTAVTAYFTSEQLLQFVLCIIQGVLLHDRHSQCNKFNPYSAEILLYKPWKTKGFVNLKSSLMS